MVEMSVQEPMITRAFQIALPTGDSVSEKVIRILWHNMQYAFIFAETKIASYMAL